MGKVAETVKADAPPLGDVLRELHGDYGRVAPSRMVELLQMLPPSGVTNSSADIIRELRGPLPDDE